MDTSDKEKVIYKTITETVIHGRGIGKHVGTPTANLKVEKQIDLSETGVYFSTILLCNQFFYGVTHIGTRPTLDNDKEISIETHILNFDKDIYGCTITIALYKRIREIQKFDNLSLLLKQIRKDCVAAQKYWRIKNQTAILVIDKETHCAMINSQNIYLSSKEFDVLYMLYSNPMSSFTKEQIYKAVWNELPVGGNHAVENIIYQIRKNVSVLFKIRILLRLLWVTDIDSMNNIRACAKEIMEREIIFA